MRDALSNFNPRETPQSESARSDQVKNNAGGYVFEVDEWTRALRFLILGTDGGTYYVNEQDLTRENAKAITHLANTQGEKLVNLILDVSENARAPRQNPTLFALAACTASEDAATRKAAMAAISRVCRTGTMLFIFARYVEQFRGWGRGLRTAIGEWYTTKPLDRVAYQAVKYRQREGWSHRDLLRLSHPKAEGDRANLFEWICRGTDASDLPSVVQGYVAAQKATHAKEWATLVTDYDLPWEALPDEAMNKPEVWEALLPNTGMTALIRQLGRLTNIGTIAPLSAQNKGIISRLTDAQEIKKSRVHPLQILTALVTYDSGHGFRGQSSWTPLPNVVEALNEAFYLAFDAVEPAGKRTLLGLDVSGSMTGGTIANSPLAPFQAEAAMAMVALRTEPEVFPMAFSGGFVPLTFTKSSQLRDVIAAMSRMPFDRTDCSVPMQWATQNKVPVDSFFVYTDNETWAGSMHPFQALRQYRDKMGIDARLAVVGMTSSNFTIADPADAGMLDVVGFDTAAPNIMNAFSRGDV
jgi:60 kDa SS-A/Ro ribonucleoprotein